MLLMHRINKKGSLCALEICKLIHITETIGKVSSRKTKY